MSRVALCLAVLCLALSTSWADDKEMVPVKDKEGTKKPGEELDSDSIEEIRRQIERRKKALFEEKQALQKNLAARRSRVGVDEDLFDPWHGIGLFRPERRRLFGDLRYWTRQRDDFVARNKGFLTEEKEKELKKLEDRGEHLREDLGLESYWWRLAGYRGASFVRHEYHRNRDFNRHVDDNDHRTPFRANLGASVHSRGLGGVTALGALSRSWGANKTRNRPQDHLDLYELFVDLTLLHNESFELTPRIGRQSMRLGSERVVGDNSFFVFNRSFDGVKLNYKDKSFDWDIFAVRPVRRRDLNDRHGNDADQRESLIGSYFRVSLSERNQVEFYAVRKQNTRRFVGESGLDPDTSTVLTSGVRWLSKLTGNASRTVISFEGEAIYQRGRVNGDSHESAALAGQITLSRLYQPLPKDFVDSLPASVSYEADRVSWLQLSFGVDWAKGDDQPSDRRSKGFQPVYPSPHLFLGSADVLGFQNIYDFQCSLTFNYRSEVEASGFSVESLSFTFHHFQRDTNNGAVFGVNGAPLIGSPIGRGSHDVGQEIDVYFQLFHYVRLGYSRFYPGRYLRRNGLRDPVNFFYLALGGK
jgi:hypothetical protein